MQHGIIYNPEMSSRSDLGIWMLQLYLAMSYFIIKPAFPFKQFDKENCASVVPLNEKLSTLSNHVTKSNTGKIMNPYNYID